MPGIRRRQEPHPLDRPPEGVFYGLLHVDGMKDSLGFAQNLMRDARVGVAPGSAFAPAADTHSDVSFASASHRMRSFWKSGSSVWAKRARRFEALTQWDGAKISFR